MSEHFAGDDSNITFREHNVLVKLALSCSDVGPCCKGEDGVGCMIQIRDGIKFAVIFCLKCNRHYVEVPEGQFDLVLLEDEKGVRH